MNRRWAIAATGWVIACCGCSDPGPKLELVSGRVTVNGKPLAAGSVSFRPDATRGNADRHHPTGAIGSDGRYELFTVGRAGAPAGRYQVLVFADANAEGGKAAHPLPAVWLTDKKYTTEATTDLTAEVIPAPEPGRYDLKLTK